MSCYRSDNRFLVLLPCPLCVKRFLNCVLPANNDLLSCGDIEANPGPSELENMLSELLQGQKIISSTVEGIECAQKEIEKKLTGINERIDGIDEQLQKLNGLAGRVQNMESIVSKLESQVLALRDQMDDIENRGRRNNLVIYGLDERNTESNDELVKKVQEDIFVKHFGREVVGIERCHRIGKKETCRSRPVTLKILDYREKMAILKSAHKLKGTHIPLSEDFSKRLRDIRQKLWKSAAGEKANGAKVKLVYDKLSINNVRLG